MGPARTPDTLGGAPRRPRRPRQPIDVTERSGGSFWGRPEALLDPGIRAGISIFALLGPEIVDRGVASLSADLADGTWDRRHGHLRSLDALDVGYRIVISTIS